MQRDNLPPTSIESEQSILGGLLIDGNAIDRIGELVEKDFYSEAHRLIFKAIQKQAADGKQWDAITVAELLEQHKKLEAAGGLLLVTFQVLQISNAMPR